MVVLPYFLAPLIGWFVSGVLKFMINYIRFGKEAKQRVGNGGFPSTHTTVVTTPSMLIGLSEGFNSPMFALAVAVTFIVIIDATGLRRAVGRHAVAINIMTSDSSAIQPTKLRESMGHTRLEIIGGLVLGILLGYLLYGIAG